MCRNQVSSQGCKIISPALRPWWPFLLLGMRTGQTALVTTWQRGVRQESWHVQAFGADLRTLSLIKT